jgi:hypothetical protein
MRACPPQAIAAWFWSGLTRIHEHCLTGLREAQRRTHHDHQALPGCVVDDQAESMMADALEARRLQDH